MALPDSSVIRSYPGGAAPTYLSASLNYAFASGQTLTVANTTGWYEVSASGYNTTNPLGTSGPFTLVVDYGLGSEEKVLCASGAIALGVNTTIFVYNVSGTNGRGYDGTTAVGHSVGSSSDYNVFPVATAIEQAQFNYVSSKALYAGAAAGGDLTGTYPNPVLKDVFVSGTFYTNEAKTTAITTDAQGRIVALSGTPIAIQTTQVSGLSSFVESTNLSISGQTVNINTLNTQVSGLNTSVSGQTVSINTLNTQVSGLSTSLDNLSISTTSGFNSVSTQISGLNLVVSGQTTSIATNASNIATLSGQYVSLSGSLNTTNSNVSTLSGQIVSLSGSYVSLSGKLDTTNSNVATLSGQMITANNGISTNATNISTLSGSVSTISGKQVTDEANIASLSGSLVTLSGQFVTTSGRTIFSGTTAGGDLTGTYPNPTLRTISGVSGTYGSATQTPLLSIDSNGRVTNAQLYTIQIAENQVNNLTTDMTSISGNIASVSGKQATDQSNIATLSGNLATLSGQYVTTSGLVTNQAGYISTISGKQVTDEANIASTSGSLATLSGQYVSTSGIVTNQTGYITTISGKQVTDEANIALLSGSLVTLSGQYVTTSGLVTNQAGYISTISGKQITDEANLATLSGQYATTSGIVTNNTGYIATISGKQVTDEANIATISGKQVTDEANIASISGSLSTVSGVAYAALPRTGGTISGSLTVTGTLSVNSTNIALGANTPIPSANAAGVAIGNYAGQTSNNNGVAVGAYAGSTQNFDGVAVGYEAGYYYNEFGVAIGYLANINNTGSNYTTAIGYQVNATAPGSVAIGTDHTGAGATSSTQDQIVLGTSNHTVNIPGKLTISGGNVLVSGTTASGDLSGTYPSPTVARIQGTSVSPTTPTNNQVLRYSTTSGAWYAGTGNALFPTATISGNYTATPNDYAVVNATVAPITITLPNAPANGSVVSVASLTTSTYNVVVTASGSDTIPGGNFTLAGNTVFNSVSFYYDSARTEWLISSNQFGDVAGGDLSGYYPNPTVNSLQGTPVSSTPPNTGQVLASVGGVWTPITSSGVGTPGPGGANGYYGAFYDTTNQTATSTTSGNVLAIGSTFTSNGITRSASGTITFGYTGTYLIAYTVQLITSASGSRNVDIWFRKNGVNVPNTNATFAVPGNNGGNAVTAAVTHIIVASGNENFQIMWMPTNTDTTVQTIASGANYPTAPGVFVSVSQIMYNQTGTYTVNTAVASGTNQATATPLTNSTYAPITGATASGNNVAGAGVVLATPTYNGQWMQIHNQDSANWLLVYPNSGATIDLEVADGPIWIPPSAFWEGVATTTLSWDTKTESITSTTINVSYQSDGGQAAINLPSTGTPGTYGTVSGVPVVTTDPQGRVSTVTVTGIQIAQNQVTGLSGNLSALSGSITTTNSNLATLSGQYATTSGIVTNQTGYISTLSGQMVTANANIASTSGSLATLSGQYVTTSGITTTNTSNIATLSGQMVTANSNIASTSGSLATLSGQYVTTSGLVTNQAGYISTLSGQMVTANSNIATISGNLVTVSGVAAAALPKAGGTMSGAIAMGSNKITGLANGTVSTDAAAFGQIPTALPPNGSAGGSLAGTYPNPAIAANVTVTGLINISGTLTAPTITNGTISGSTLSNITVGGDLTGTLPNPTLAAVGTSGTYGSATAVPIIVTDSKGRVTGVTTAAPLDSTKLATSGGFLTGPLSTNSNVTVTGTTTVSGALNVNYTINASTPTTNPPINFGGGLSYSDVNTMAGFNNSVNNYNQVIIQNTNSGTSASTNLNVSNNLGTSGTNYGEFGMNSSNFTGTGAFSTAGAVYLSSASTDLAIGTYGNNAIHFVTNSAASDAMTITSGGNVVVASGFTVSGTSTQIGNVSFSGAVTVSGAAVMTSGSAVGGDLTGTIGNATVTKLQGYTVLSGAPTTNAMLVYSGSQWRSGPAVSGTTGTGGIIPYATNPLLVAPLEQVVVSSGVISSSAAATLNVVSGGVYVYTAAPTSAWQIQITNAPTTVGQAVTVTVGTNNGATAYLPSGFTINGYTVNGGTTLPAHGTAYTNTITVTAYYQGGSIWTSADATINYDFYAITLICIATNTYVMLLGQTKF
jgi:peptidoglycan hydrolase CwlO-like protein